jgi:hypothetical protein
MTPGTPVVELPAFTRLAIATLRRLAVEVAKRAPDDAARARVARLMRQAEELVCHAHVAAGLVPSEPIGVLTDDGTIRPMEARDAA